MIDIKTFMVKSRADLDIIDITDKVQGILEKSKIQDGVVTVFAKGSTASVSTMEYELNLKKDVERMFERIVPSDISYDHHKTWGDGNGKSHVRATLTGPSLTVPLKNKKMLLGTWQQIVLLDFDVPAREREVVVTVVGE